MRRLSHAAWPPIGAPVFLGETQSPARPCQQRRLAEQLVRFRQRSSPPAPKHSAALRCTDNARSIPHHSVSEATRKACQTHSTRIQTMAASLSRASPSGLSSLQARRSQHSLAPAHAQVRLFPLRIVQHSTVLCCGLVIGKLSLRAPFETPECCVSLLEGRSDDMRAREAPLCSLAGELFPICTASVQYSSA